MINNLFTVKRISCALLSLSSVFFAANSWGFDEISIDKVNNLFIDVDLGRFPAWTKGSTLTVYFDSTFSRDINYKFDQFSTHYWDFYSTYSSYYVFPPRAEGEGNKRKINEDINLTSLAIDGRELLTTRHSGLTFYSIFLANFKTSKKSGKVPATINIKGSLMLELSRDIIGGLVAVPTEIPLAYSTGATREQPNVFPYENRSSIFARIYLKTSGFIPAPAMCKIHIPGGEHIDFGNIVTDSLTPERENENRQAIELDYRCNLKKTLPAKVLLLARNASFSSNVIASTNPAVGITLSRNGTPLTPGTTFSTRLQGGQGHDTLTAMVTRNPAVSPAELDTGPFSASAVLILEQQ